MLIIVETLVVKKLFKHYMAKLWKLGLLSMAVQRL